MDARIELIGPENIDLLDDIATEVFDAPLTDSWLVDHIADPSNILLVALKVDIVVGQLKAVLHRHPEKPPGLFIEELGVGSHHRRQGIATALMQAATALAKQHGCAELWLATEPENDPANALYKVMGLEGQHVVMYSQKIDP